VALLLVPEEHEGSDAGGYEGDDEVFVGSEFASVEDDVHEHDWDEFARFREDHGRVGDIRQSGETEGRSCGYDDRTLEVLPQKGLGVSFCSGERDPVLDKLLRFGPVFVLVLLFVFLVGGGGTVRLGAVLG